MHDGAAGERRLCAHGSAVTEAHRAQTSRSEECARRKIFAVLRRPHLVLTHVGDHNAVLAHMVAHRLYYFKRLQNAVLVHGLCVLALQGAQAVRPLLARLVFQLGRKGFEHMRHVAYKRVSGRYVLVYLGGVYVDMHDFGARCELFLIGGDAVGKTRTHGNHQIGFRHSHIRRARAVMPYHMQIKRTALARRRTHKRVRAGQIALFKQLFQLF